MKEKVKLYDQILEKCPHFDRKGKNMAYTSANGYMFSQVNKAGELGIRFDKKRQEELFRELDTVNFKSYGANMQGYVLMPEALWNEPEKLIAFLNESYDYVMTLEPK